MGMERPLSQGNAKKVKGKAQLPSFVQKFIADKNESRVAPHVPRIHINRKHLTDFLGSAAMGVALFGGGGLATNAHAGQKKTIESVLTRFENVESVFTSRDAQALARNVYREAGGEPFKGQLAVAQVTIARALDPREQFGDGSIHGTVYKKNQFSWTRKIVVADEIKMENSDQFKNLVTFFEFVLVGKSKVDVMKHLSTITKLPLSTLYYKRTDWNRSTMEKNHMSEATVSMFEDLIETGIIGNHTFYRERTKQDAPRVAK